MSLNDTNDNAPVISGPNPPMVNLTEDLAGLGDPDEEGRVVVAVVTAYDLGLMRLCLLSGCFL